jgi:amidohydrolase
MIEKIKQLSEQYFQEIVAIRRHLHQHPELSFQEFETSKFIQQTLTDWGIEFKSGYVNTGIVALVKGKNPEKKIIALRADIDALPILEENNLPFASQNKGVMHACGHDAHTASLLGAIKILNELKNEFEGTIKCIFQPAEEVLPGGASLMIKEGVLENPKPMHIVGQHVYPELEAGKVGFKKGQYMASTDEIYLTIKGKGGHAALPFKLKDPVLATAQILVALQQVVSRCAKPNIPSVLSFGKVIANGATNIIPNEVFVEGTFRTFDEEWRKKAHNHIREIAENTAKAMGVVCDVKIDVGYPFLVNDDDTTQKCIDAAKEFLGEENVVDLELRMTAEDFAYYSQIIPACFYRLGTSDSTGLHTPTFMVDEEALKTGMGLMAYISLKN